VFSSSQIQLPDPQTWSHSESRLRARRRPN